MYWLILTARAAHVLGGVFWVGATMLQTLFLGPVLITLEPALAQQIVLGMRARGLRHAMTGSALLTVGTGVVLLSLGPGLGNLHVLLETHWGIFIIVGAMAAIAMLCVGVLAIEPRLAKLGASALGHRVLSDGELLVMSGQLMRFAIVEVFTGIVAVVSMAVARYA